MDEQQSNSNWFFYLAGIMGLFGLFFWTRGHKMNIEDKPILPKSAAARASVADAGTTEVIMSLEQELPPPVEMLTPLQCDESCRGKVKQQETLNRGMPASIQTVNTPAGGFGSGEYRVLWADCDYKVFVGHPSRSREIPYLFLWPRNKDCACKPGHTLLRLAEDGSCELIK